MAETAWLNNGTAIPGLSQIDLNLFDQWHPSVRAEWQQESTRDAKSKAHLAQIGGTNYEGYLEWWLRNQANGTGLGVPLKASGPPTPAVPPPPVDQPGPGPSQDNTNALQGLIDQLLGGYNQQMREAEAATAARNNAISAVRNTLGDPASKFTADMFGTVDDDLVNNQFQTTQQMLDRAKARGQVNDVGYNAGLTKLNASKTGTNAKLTQTMNDILGGYRTRYKEIMDEAMGAASSTSTTSPFDVSSYAARAKALEDEARSTAGGLLYNQLGNTNLFDYGLIRGAAGQAQGAINLKNLDVMDALAKRKSVASVGRGLGSQGTF